MDTVTLPPLTRSLTALSGIMTKAEAHCEANSIDPAVLIGDRLFADMFPLSRQVQLTCDFSARMVARLCGQDPASFADVETTFPELRDRIAKASDYIAGFTPADFEGSEEREIVLSLRGGELRMSGQEYHSLFALPQVYFHMTSAYNILRHNGVPLGKMDFMGAR